MAERGTCERSVRWNDREGYDSLTIPSGNSYTIVIKHEITVRVVCDNGAPMAGFGVTLRGNDGLEVVTTSDFRGLAQFDNLSKNTQYKLCLPGRDRDAWKMQELLDGDVGEPDEMAMSGRGAAPMPSDIRPTRQIVKQSDCIASIAFRYDLAPEAVWEHPDNRALKDLRQDPHRLMSGDEVVIPECRPQEFDVRIGGRYQVKLLGVTTELTICFEDFAGEPRARRAYLLEAEGVSIEGETDESGLLSAWLLADSREARIKWLDGGEAIDVELGSLDPQDSESGAAGMLGNLGYMCGREDDDPADVLRNAIRDFRADHELDPAVDPDDALDQETLDRLKEVYQGSFQ